MTKDSALEVLAPELQQHILTELDSLDALHTLLRASPRIYQVFRLNRDTILSIIVLNQFHPAVQPEAIAVAKLAKLQHQSPEDIHSRRDTAKKFCDTFPDQVYSWCESNLIEPVSIQLCKLARATRFFIDDYTRNTLPIVDQLGRSQDLPILAEYPLCSDIQHLHLSSTEIARLQRAFCRFELYRHLFSRCTHDVPDGAHKCMRDPITPAAEQARIFLQNLPVFQITEIASVRDYLFRRLRGICDSLESEAVRTLPFEAMTFKEFDELARWRSPFYLFTTEAKHEQDEHLEHLTTLGLPYIRRIMQSHGDEQRNLFLHHVRASVLHHFERDFLTKALQCLPSNPNFVDDCNALRNIAKEFTPACDESGYSELPQGWLWAHHHLQPYMLWNHGDKGWRDWGYVFWDYDRLRDSGILGRDPHPVRQVRFKDYPGYGRPSVEQRMHAPENKREARHPSPDSIPN